MNNYQLYFKRSDKKRWLKTGSPNKKRIINKAYKRHQKNKSYDVKMKLIK